MRQIRQVRYNAIIPYCKKRMTTMKPFDPRYTEARFHRENSREPDFNNLLKVLKREKSDRPTLFEFFLNGPLQEKLAGKPTPGEGNLHARLQHSVEAFRIAGYDYITTFGSDFMFQRKKRRHMASVSMNGEGIISDRKSFEEYPWPDPEQCDYSRLEALNDILPDGMKAIVFSADGVLENVIGLVGFDNLCYMLADDPELVQELFKAVGSRLLRYFEICSSYSSVGAVMSNDDWGFNSQTMLSVPDMRKYVIPWHRKIVQSARKAGKPVMLHSCGMLDLVMDDIIDDIGFDAKHSYEDKIRPVEEAYEKYNGRIAVLGGIDVDFLCRSTPEEIYHRSAAMLERAASRGGYALGSGNSIPYYVPQENYLAMVAAAKWGLT